MKNSTSKSQEKRLIRRYLLWCYKTTKEELDRIDRKFTQLMVDDFLGEQLTKSRAGKSLGDDALGKQILQFHDYVAKKRADALAQKYVTGSQKIFHPNYEYLQIRFRAIQAAIQKFLGKAELAKIDALYEEEMTRRILAERNHS